jgi:hypothetical protein
LCHDSDLKIEEGESLDAFNAGISPERRERTGVAIKRNKVEEELNCLGRDDP